MNSFFPSATGLGQRLGTWLPAMAVVTLAFGAGARSAQAGELHQLYRGARTEAMGGAYTALADDEQAIFLNPAGLAGIEHLQFNYLITDFTVSSDIISTAAQASSAFSKLSGNSLNLIMGKNIYAEVQLAPTLVGPGFGFSVLADQQVALRSENKALPQITFGYQTTDGFQLAYGTTIGKGKRGFFGDKVELRLGGAAKMLFRRGGYRRLSPLTLFQLSPAKAQELIGPWGKGYGLDLGSQLVYRANKRLNFYAGLAMTDVGDTCFGDGPDPIKSVLSGGFAARYDLGVIHIKTIYDQRHILQVTDWRKKNHFGVELGLPMLSIYGGINGVYPTYGVSFDIWVLSLTAASYVEEQGSFVYQDPEHRWMTRLAFKFEL